MDYVYGEHLRWKFFFDNPNHAGAFLATLIPLAWGMISICERLSPRKRIATKIFAWIIYFGLWFCLLKTYSRGALVAALMAWGYGLWKGRRLGGERWAPVLVTLAAVLIMAIVSGSGFRAVNSYLTYATERGVFLSGLWGWAVLLLWWGSGSNTLPQTMARSSLLAFGTSGFFSTTFEVASLWVIPLVSLMFLAGTCWNQWKKEGGGREFLRKGTQSLAFMTALVALLILLGSLFNLRDPLIRHFKGARIELSSRKGGNGSAIVFLPDSEVMGTYYGRWIRRLCLNGNCRVITPLDAENGGPKNFLRREFPGKTFRRLPALFIRRDGAGGRSSSRGSWK